MTRRVVDGGADFVVHAAVPPAAHDDCVEEAVRPFLKWAGGKRQLLPVLRSHVPAKIGRYFEPFVGGGALFFDRRPKRPILADVNDRLIRTYRGVKNDLDAVIRLLESHRERHSDEFFEEMRQENIDAASDAEVAAWFIYLNKTGFNGLYRVNSRNRFNVPPGRYENPAIFNETTLRACSAALAGTELVLGDFETVALRAKRGDFVYFDPPYEPLSPTSNFTAYAQNGFTSHNQRELRDMVARLSAGCDCMVSNSTAPLIEELYAIPPFKKHYVMARRAINRDAAGRGMIPELVVTTYTVD